MELVIQDIYSAKQKHLANICVSNPVTNPLSRRCVTSITSDPPSDMYSLSVSSAGRAKSTPSLAKRSIASSSYVFQTANDGSSSASVLSCKLQDLLQTQIGWPPALGLMDGASGRLAFLHRCQFAVRVYGFAIKESNLKTSE
jgi:hypothetical protein